MDCPFDHFIDRRNTQSLKWDGVLDLFGTDNLIPMWVADMDFRPPEEVVKAVTERAAHGIYGYERCCSGHVDAFTSWLKKRHDWHVERNFIQHSPGVVPGLIIALLALTEPGERVVIQPPVYPPFFKVVQDNQRIVVENPLIQIDDNFTMNFTELEEIFESGVKTMIMCSPHNPVGRVWTKSELQRLANLVIKYNVTLLSDEIWSDLIFAGHKHIPIASLSPRIAERTLTFMAPSKTFNVAGFYLSNVIIPNPMFHEKFTQQVERLGLNHLSFFGIVACKAAYEHGEKWLDSLLIYLEENINYVIAKLAEIAPPIQVLRPEGTFVLWLDCRELGIPVEELNRFFVQKAQIAFNDGGVFGPAGQGFQRMNIGCPRVLITEALTRIEKALKEIHS